MKVFRETEVLKTAFCCCLFRSCCRWIISESRYWKGK